MIEDQALRSYEKYIFSDRNINEALNTLPVNSEDYLFLKLIHVLNNTGLAQLTNDNEIKKALGELKSRYGSEKTQMITLREALLSFDVAKDDEERKKHLSTIRNYTTWYRDYSKPTNLKKIKKNEDAKGADDTSEEEDEALRGYSSEFNSETSFTKESMTNGLMSMNYQGNIHPRYYPNLDYTKMTYNERSFEDFIKGGALKHIDFKNDSFDKRLMETIKKYEHGSSMNYLLYKLGVQDLLQLYKKHKIFQNQDTIYEIVRKRFFREFYEGGFSTLTINEKLKMLAELEQFVTNAFGKDENLERTIRFFQLNYLYEENKFDEKKFHLYAQKPHSMVGNFIDDKPTYYDSPWNNLLQNLDYNIKNSTRINQVIEANLEYQQIHLKEDIVKKYGKIFHESNLKRLQVTFNYLHNNIHDVDQDYQYVITNLQHQTYIRLCHYNKKQFGLSEEIELFADIKNIQKVQVKVFEINTDNYFRKNMSPFTSDINLDGLIAKYEQEYIYQEIPANVQHTEHFYFPHFNNVRGLFVIEFIGNGISSRAIVQKGNLSLIRKSTIAGHFAFILDESNQICKGSYSGIFFDNNFYPTDKDTGRIIIPFARYANSSQAILMQPSFIIYHNSYEGFAQLATFRREDERYNFSASFILHDESVIMGNLAKILIKPTLVLNDRELADLRLLENTRVTLTTVNKIDNITISKSFEDVKLNSEEEYEVEFQVPPNIAEIRVNVTTQVVSKNEKTSFNQSHTFTVNNHSNDFDFSEAFLRNVGGNYEYVIKGKNGEAKSGVLVDFEFKNKYYYSNVSKTLKTDKQGTIKLGRLRNITYVNATPRPSRIVRQIQKQWILPSHTHITYPQSISILDKESIRLPFKHSSIKPTNFQLLQMTSGSQYIENMFNKAQFVKNDKSAFGVNYINISGLQEGNYMLWLKKEEVYIMIQVVSGEYWNQSKDFIIQQRMMIERTKTRTESIRIENLEIKNVKIDEDGEEKTVQNVKVEIGGDFNLKTTKVHAWAFKFFPHNLSDQLTEKFGKNLNFGGGVNMFGFVQWNNIFMSNRALSDENRYIMERKYQEKTIGNFLEKPSVLLKRNYIQDTTFSQEQLNKGGDYDRIQAQIQPEMDMHRSRRMMASAPPPPGAPSNRMGINPGFLMINGFQNFLKHSAETALNIKVNASAQAEFEMNLEPYSTLIIVVTSDDQCSHVIQPIQGGQIIPQRDLSLLKAYEQEKSFSETRRTTNCLKYDAFTIEDITSTEMQIIDSLQKVWLVQKELRKPSTEDTEFIEAMLKWPTFDNQKRIQVYSDYCSHEFNVFLKLKDPLYFEEVVKPFLTNKIEKMFVDYWLLDYDNAMIQFEEPHKLKDMNAFEQCLLIHFLVSKGKKERAQEIANGIKNRNSPPSIDHMNRIYDIVLNMNSLNSKPKADDIMDLINQEKKKMTDMKIREQNDLLDMAYPVKASMAMCKEEKYCEAKEDECYEGALFDDDDLLCGALECEMASKPSEANMMMRSCSPRSDPFADLHQFDQLQAIRKQQKPNFKALDNTKEYAETHYYKQKSRDYFPHIINQNSLSLWQDLSQHIVQQGALNAFLSVYFTLALSNLNELALALALLDLPFNEESHGFKTGQGRSVEIKAASNMVIFLKEIQEADTKINKDLLVVHRYFEKDKMEREVDEFIINECYACQVIVTNISNKNIKFQALVQVPEGALPLYTSHYQKSYNHNLGAFSTLQFVFYFYFPDVGTFAHFPTNISVDRIVVAKAPPATLKVRKVQTKVNEDDFDDILATGSIPNILNFMRNKNILSPEVRFNFENIYWLCKDQTFFSEGIKILKSKNIFDKMFWAHSIYHMDIEHMRQYFNCTQDLKRKVGSQFESILVSVNNHDESHDIFNFLDYYPLVNARAHRLGGMDQSSSNSSNETKQWILNENLRSTYKKFIMHMVSKRFWTAHDRLMFVNYLLMQERVAEAVTEFKKITDISDIYGDAQIQFDYMKAYLDFYECGKIGSLEFKEAREVVAKYNNHPVQHWRKLFKEIADQLAEIDEAYNPREEKKQSQIDNFEDTEQERKRKQVKMEPQMDFVIEEKTIHIDYVNIENVKINYYMIDLEILFSKTPFLNSDTQDFSFVQPFASEELWLDSNMMNFKYPIPEDLSRKNLVIEISNAKSGIKSLKTYFSADLRVRVIENFGELKVFLPNALGQDTPLPKTYVKVYQRKKGSSQVVFFKDGYTDLRGRFDYGQLSGTSVADVERFAIFVSNEEHGSLIKEAKPPSGLKK